MGRRGGRHRGRSAPGGDSPVGLRSRDLGRGTCPSQQGCVRPVAARAEPECPESSGTAEQPAPGAGPSDPTAAGSARANTTRGLCVQGAKEDVRHADGLQGPTTGTAAQIKDLADVRDARQPGDIGENRGRAGGNDAQVRWRRPRPTDERGTAEAAETHGSKGRVAHAGARCDYDPGYGRH